METLASVVPEQGGKKLDVSMALTGVNSVKDVDRRVIAEA